MTPYKVKCLDARYDASAGMLVLNCVFLHNSERKIVVFHKQDIAPLFHRIDLSDSDMLVFTRCMAKRNTPFNLVIGDDPNREQIPETQQVQYASMFNKRISDELKKVCEGLEDDMGQIQRKLGRLRDEGKIDPIKLLQEERVIRAHLGS